jgi:hypothetical protein
MKKRILAMVLVAAMVASMGVVAQADNVDSNAGIAFWANPAGPDLVDPGEPGTVPGERPEEPDYWRPPPGTPPDVVQQIRDMQSSNLHFHRHNLAIVRQRGKETGDAGKVTMQSVESIYTLAELENGIPRTAVGVPNRVLGDSRLAALVYMEGFGNWTLQVSMGGFTYDISEDQKNIPTMKGYDIELIQHGITIDAAHPASDRENTTWNDNIDLSVIGGSRYIVGENAGGQGIHGKEYRATLTFHGSEAPPVAVDAQADIHWTLSTNLKDGIARTDADIGGEFGLDEWELSGSDPDAPGGENDDNPGESLWG